MPKIKVIKKESKKPIKSMSKMEAAAEGKMGKLAQKGAMFAKNALASKK